MFQIFLKKVRKTTWEKTLLIGLALVILLIFALLPDNLNPILLVTNHDPQGRNKVLTAALVQEISQASNKIQEVEFSDTLAQFTQEQNFFHLVGLLEKINSKYNFDKLRVVNSNGLLLASFPDVKEQGNNVYLTTEWKNIFSQTHTQTLFGRGTHFPLVLVTSQPIIQDNSLVGTILGTYFLDNDYAKVFRDTYFDQDVDIVFYTRDEGLVGSTFTDADTVKLMNAYLGIGAEDLRLGKGPLLTHQGVKFSDGYHYIHDIALDDSGQYGVLLIHPSSHQSNVIVITAIVTFLFFLFQLYVHRGVLKHSWSSRHFFWFIIITFIFFFSTFIIWIYQTDKAFLALKPSPYLIYNSTLKFSPEATVFDKKFEQSIALQLNSGGESINAVEAIVHFDPTSVSVVEVDTTRSFCDPGMFLEKSIDEQAGVVRVTCVVPSPGFSESSGIVAELLVQAVRDGAFTLTYDGETKVLAHDGLGTNVLRLAENGSYQAITDFITNSQAFVFSITHPNQARWYHNPNIHIAWLANPGFSYRYAVDQLADTVTLNSTSTTNTYDFSVNKSGTYYFHIQPLKVGKQGVITHYPIHVDIDPPDKPKILASARTVKSGDVVRLNFSSHDSLSGLQKTFYVKIGDSLLLPATAPLFIPLVEKGPIIIVVRAFDQAGNFGDSAIKIEVE